MKEPDPIFLLIDNYCRSYNKANKKEIFSSWYYIPAFSAIAAVMYWKVGINGFMCSMVAGWGLLLTVYSIMNRRMSLSKLRMEYSCFKNNGPVMGLLVMTFYHFWPILEALIITPKEDLQKSNRKNVMRSDGMTCLK